MNRINILLKQNRRLFHTADLALLWGIHRPNTLYTTIKRYIQKGILIPIQKGLYSVVPLTEVGAEALGLAAIHTYGYVGCETVLAAHGVIFQEGHATTIVSSMSRRFTLGGYSFLIRKMRDAYLYNTAGIDETGGIKTATLARAAADMAYFHPSFHMDWPRVIDWKAVGTIQKEVGFS
ncbi:MAG TPA: type IV toxin-antitoxin system AbiEi family antitoxin domain-containing protein [Patescibacteria group bacterium]|nr:type IV toxin-antitoxin system AbiEi family antitoxin domain-containing protein [Patescibacteria group bacterium]